ncbi:UNVERIFIED_CONTAM: methyltransferase type 11 [Euhalothece sp. KZN 001]
MDYLNLGCGRRYHPDWTNLDFRSTGEGVIAHNLNQNIPFPNESFDVVYHSHLLEHFSRSNAESFLKECYRVLRPQGVLRVVVPDLEQIAITYLTALEKADGGFEQWQNNYEWILLEMYDQTVRNHSGGDMAAYLSRESIPNEDFIIERLGTEAKNLIEAGKRRRQQPESTKATENRPKRIAKEIYRFLRYSNHRRELILKRLLGSEYKDLQIGRFRQGGEVHQWMYDRYSLSVLLNKIGLEKVKQCSAKESYVPNWINWNLDTEPDGSIYKPDSLYMEGIKPNI